MLDTCPIIRSMYLQRTYKGRRGKGRPMTLSEVAIKKIARPNWAKKRFIYLWASLEEAFAAYAIDIQ